MIFLLKSYTGLFFIFKRTHWISFTSGTLRTGPVSVNVNLSGKQSDWPVSVGGLFAPSGTLPAEGAVTAFRFGPGLCICLPDLAPGIEP